MKDYQVSTVLEALNVQSKSLDLHLQHSNVIFSNFSTQLGNTRHERATHVYKFTGSNWWNVSDCLLV